MLQIGLFVKDQFYAVLFSWRFVQVGWGQSLRHHERRTCSWTTHRESFYDEIRFARLPSSRFEAMQQGVDEPSLRAKCSCDREEPLERRWNLFSVFQAIGGNPESQ